MKLVFCIQLLLFSSFCSFSQSKTDIDKLGLKGRIKTIKEDGFAAVDSFGEIKKNQYLGTKWVVEFHKNGFKKEEYIYLYPVSISLLTKTVYNDTGQIIEKYEYSYKNILETKSIYIFSTEGAFLGINKYNSDNILISKEYSDDKNNNIVLKLLPDGQIEEKRIIRHLDNKIETLIYSSDGKLRTREVGKYDNNRLTEIQVFESDGRNYKSFTTIYENDIRITTKQEKHSTIINKFNTKDQIVEYQIYDHYESDKNNSNNFRATYSYYNDKIAEIKHYKDGSIIDIIEFKYDIKEEIIETIYYKGDHSFNYSETYNKEYDNNGNWIKEVMYKNGFPTEIKVRSIEYY